MVTLNKFDTEDNFIMKESNIKKKLCLLKRLHYFPLKLA